MEGNPTLRWIMKLGGCKVTRVENPFQHQDRHDNKKDSRETEQCKESNSKELKVTLVSKELQTIKANKEERKALRINLIHQHVHKTNSVTAIIKAALKFKDSTKP